MTLDETDEGIPCAQTLEDTHMRAVQIYDPSQRSCDIEVFRITREQDVEDRILAKVSLDGSQIQFNAPRISRQVVGLIEKLHQLGDILQIDMRCSPRGVSSIICTVVFFGSWV